MEGGGVGWIQIYRELKWLSRSTVFGSKTTFDSSVAVFLVFF